MRHDPQRNLPTDEAPITERLGAFELAFVLAALDEKESSSSEDQGPSTDDEPTLERPAPPLPPGLPSPLGDETIRVRALDLDGVFHAPPSAYGLGRAVLFGRTLASRGFRPRIHAPAKTPDSADLHFRRALIASWTIAVAMVGLCTYMLSAL